MEKETVYKIIASGLGIGRLNQAPNLMASIFALLVALLVKQLPFAQVSLFTLILITVIIGSYCAHKFIEKKEDKPSWIVVDEIVGTWIALYFFSESLLLNLFAFSTYRLVSFFKPLIKTNRNGKSHKWLKFIMLDDILAGVFANSLVYFILLFIVENK